jgi:hypothetical protein
VRLRNTVIGVTAEDSEFKIQSSGFGVGDPEFRV